MKRVHSVSCPTGKRFVVLTRQHGTVIGDFFVVNVNKTAMGTVGKSPRPSKRATPWMANDEVHNRATYHKTALQAVRRLACAGR